MSCSSVNSNSVGDPELPAYSRRDPVESPDQVKHTYSLGKNAHQPLTLSFRSKAKSTDDVPVVHEGQRISGSVCLNLDGETFIRSVTVTIMGDIIAPWGANRFLTMREELYSVESKEGSPPRTPPSRASPPRTSPPRTSPSRDTSSQLQTAGESKLTGTNTWSFAFKLPKGVGIPYSGSGGAVTKYVLPASFHDTLTKTSIVYQVLVRVKRGMLSTDYRLSAPFEYLPLIRPDAPSILRQATYMEATPLLGPVDDPVGWKTLDLLTVSGTWFNTREVNVSCSVSLALPTCYLRGMPIHIWVNLKSSDEQVLDLLSSTSAIDIRLVRTISHQRNIVNMGVVGSHQGPLVTQSTDIASGKFWQADVSRDKEAGSRELVGEIIVPADVSPACDILDLALGYAVVVHSFKAAGFTPAAQSAKPLLKEDIKIATLPAAGPLPLPRTPPSYEDDT
ncbi:hypothetical protein NM688_g2788 [Phlebia brevispora]|uniref:Uncharacterized protein n=1 Tax=Phlebia brevispora TaxID=194682 RepID=A0ACC1T7C5_9APHY|nr:hypothetical protein NM688_g2788 [Phlebia brevispora]